MDKEKKEKEDNGVSESPEKTTGKDKESNTSNKSSPDRKKKGKKLFAFWAPSKTNFGPKARRKLETNLRHSDPEDSSHTPRVDYRSNSTLTQSHITHLTENIKQTRSTPTLPTLTSPPESPEPSDEETAHTVENRHHGSAPARERSILSDVQVDEEEKPKTRQRRSVGPPVKRMTSEEATRLSEAADRRKSGGRPKTVTDTTINPFAAYPQAPNSLSGLISSGGVTDGRRVIRHSSRFRIAYAETPGRRESMEDSMVIHGQLCNNTADLVAIFDGHNGNAVANFLQLEIPPRLEEFLDLCETPAEALIKTFTQTNKVLQRSSIVGGSTALAVLCKGDSIFFANAGDSRAVLCSKSLGVRITRDHKSSDESEIKRIKGAGGEVTSTSTVDGRAIHRVGGVLTVTRAFGDFEVGPVIAPEPEIYEIKISEKLNSDDDVIIVACDGLYDALEDSEVAETVASFLKYHRGDLEGVCKRLRDIAFSRQSKDNITVIAIQSAPKPTML